MTAAVPGASSLLSLSGVRKSFGSRRETNVVLRSIDLEVASGECVVLIGASGSGKSTLLRCINLLETVDDGIITLDGVEITDPGVAVDRIRGRIGIVFQAYNLFPHLSVIDNITLAPTRVHKVPVAAARRRAMEMLERVGLPDKATARPDDLSGGQQQRVAIARALVNDPAVMLLDEVTSALDPELVGEVLDLLAELRSEGMTMIINTHEMSFASRIADRICFLHGGEIHEQGTPAEILQAPRRERTRQFLSRLADRTTPPSEQAPDR
ncbi:amino acid ABC transporter ATP-binding protein [Microlunatus soli]|uniref:Amino acid ABC transporter ATP-binding protein, PAAT family n=1 Tax=Microlunatus soli TaxID=630515 RepID=A0A1H1SXG8_9ACTN|nr:amino acid ABC transporter ATP-binding protein [Microlunatus soli]SDS52416.1 amino acid ABC transporter ATP-binding protein, PAAT family [Microlunatus soli]